MSDEDARIDWAFWAVMVALAMAGIIAFVLWFGRDERRRDPIFLLPLRTQLNIVSCRLPSAKSMTSDRKQPGVAFWATVVVVVLVAYPVSFGPACWLVRHGFVSAPTAAHLYRPILRHSAKLPPIVHRAIVSYAGHDADQGGTFLYLNLVLLEESLLSP